MSELEEIASVRGDWNAALDRASAEIEHLRQTEQRLKERTIERDYHMRIAVLLSARIRQIEPAMASRTNWNKVMEGYGGVHPDDNNPVTITRGTARLAMSALRSQNAADYYHNCGAAESELNAVLGKSP